MSTAAAPTRPELAHDVLRHARRRPLDAMLAPRNIAIIDASERAGSVGKALLDNLGLFDGRVFPVNPKHKMVGRLSKLHGTNEAEFALTVSDQWQGHGLGTQLLKLLVQVGRDEKIERITATMLADNHEMQHIARKAGFKVEHMLRGSEYSAETVL